MTRKEEIQAEIAKLQAELEVLNSQKPFVLWSSGNIEQTKSYDQSCILQGNIFETLEAAERERDRRALIKELRDRAGGYKPMWIGEYNYYIGFNFNCGYEWNKAYMKDVCPRSGYFKEPIEGLIEEFGDRLNLLRDV